VTTPDSPDQEWKPLRGRGIPEGCQVKTYLDSDGDVHVKVAQDGSVVYKFFCLAWWPGLRGRIPRRIRRYFRKKAREQRRLAKTNRKLDSLQRRTLHREEEEK